MSSREIGGPDQLPCMESPSAACVDALRVAKVRSSSTSTSRVPSPDFKAARGDTVANSRDAAKIPIQHTKKDGQNIDVSNITSTSVGVIDQHQKLNAALSSTDFKEPSCCSIRKGMGHQSTSRSSLKGKIKEMY